MGTRGEGQGEQVLNQIFFFFFPSVQFYKVLKWIRRKGAQRGRGEKTLGQQRTLVPRKKNWVIVVVMFPRNTSNTHHFVKPRCFAKGSTGASAVTTWLSGCECESL